MMDFPPKASHKRLCLPSATGQPVASRSPCYKVSFVPHGQRGGTLGSIHQALMGDTVSESCALPTHLPTPPPRRRFKALGFAATVAASANSTASS